MAESADFMTFATSVRGIREAVQAQRIPFVLHFEGAKPFGENTELVNAFQTCGVRSAQLTWNGRNLVADGAGERSGAGLSNFGVDLVREMNRQHMLIDLSHISDRGFWDALEFSQDPMIVSHANCRSLCDHPRNLTDDQIKALAGKGGVIGVCFYSGFISKNEATLDKLLDHLDHIVDLVGVEHVGVGPDFVYYDHAYLTVKYPKGLEDTTKMLNLTEGLMTRGYSDEEITKIWGENLLGVYQRVWGS
jgi:membrane dipeptidase